MEALTATAALAHVRTIGAAPTALKPLYVTIAQAKAITNLGHTTVYRLIKEGRIKTIKVGSRTLAVYASLEALAAGEAA